MAAKGRVKWYGNEVLVQIEKAKQEMVDKAAFLIEGQTKRNIVSNGQVDTGFMLNSTYTVTPKNDTYGEARSDAKGRNPEGDMAPKASPPDKGAVVAVGAAYAIYPEEQNSFLFRAAEQVAKSQGGQVVAAGKKALE